MYYQEEKINEVLLRMIEFDQGDAKRIQHFLKVHAFSKLIGEKEQLEEKLRYTLELAAIVHDIGILPAEQKYGRCDGPLQEKEGPAYAKQLLEEVGVEEEIIQRVCYLVGHHHTYHDVKGMDYRILLEADFLVNLCEDDAGEQEIRTAYEYIFETTCGKQICSTMFNIIEIAEA